MEGVVRSVRECVCAWMCMCVCVRERERERERTVCKTCVINMI